jgi:hypothetical protein
VQVFELDWGEEVYNAAIGHKEGFLKLNDMMCLMVCHWYDFLKNHVVPKQV